MQNYEISNQPNLSTKTLWVRKLTISNFVVEHLKTKSNLQFTLKIPELKRQTWDLKLSIVVPGDAVAS